MSTMVERSLTEPAHEAARAAADRVGIEIHSAVAVDDAELVSALLEEVWGTPPGSPPIPIEMLRALTHIGCYVTRAEAGSETVGASVGLFGHDTGGFNLHSFVTGVKEGFRGGSVGFALKQHQRAWALDHGVRVITWTFDPLVRRNAYFNLMKLGANVAGYTKNFYGTMTDALNAGDESDRMLIEWVLDDQRAVSASRAGPEPLDPAAFEGAVRRVSVGTDGAPVVEPARSSTELVQVPEDIVTLRSAHPELALRWRTAVRETLGVALAAGYRAVGVTRDGWYVLRDGAPG